jgi:hypothetical protein
MKENFQEALDLVDRDGKLRKTIWGQFWSSHQRFFKYLCMACKVPHVVELARKALANNKCVVIGLQSTGEARTLEQLGDECFGGGGAVGGEMSDFVSTARGVLQNLVDKYFPLVDHQTGSVKMGGGNSNSMPVEPAGEEKKGGKKASKNSQHVNNILQRLSSYASEKKEPRSTHQHQRSSSISTTMSDEDDENNRSELDDDDELDEDDNNEDDAAGGSDSLTGSEFDEDDEFFDSSFEDDTNNDDFKNIASAVSQTIKPLKTAKTPTDSGLSMHFKPNDAICDMNNNNKDDSDDSDSLFSITKSVSVQLLVDTNNLVNRRKRLRHLAKKKAEANKKATNELGEIREPPDQLDLNGGELDESTSASFFYYSSDESDDEFRLTTKRLKMRKPPSGQCAVKKEEPLAEDLFR